MLRGHIASNHTAHVYNTAINGNRECCETHSTDVNSCIQCISSNKHVFCHEIKLYYCGTLLLISATSQQH